MARLVQGKRIEDYNYVCEINGRQGDYVRVGRPGATHTRVAKADLRNRVIAEESVLVPTGSVTNLRQFSEVLADLFAPPVPALPANNVQRVDDEVMARVQAEAVPLVDTFNTALRRLLGLDPPRMSAQPNGNGIVPTV
jgi:hypothetical protein